MLQLCNLAAAKSKIKCNVQYELKAESYGYLPVSDLLVDASVHKHAKQTSSAFAEGR